MLHSKQPRPRRHAKQQKHPVVFEFKSFIVMLGVAWCAAGIARGEVVCTHQDANDPATEGWTYNDGDGPDLSLGPVTAEPSGFDAWFTDDQSTASGSFGQYQCQPTGQQAQDAMNKGWTLTTRMQVVNDDDAASLPVMVEYHTATDLGRFNLALNTDGNEHLVIHTWKPGGVIDDTYTHDSGGYHLIEMVFDPASDTADVFVDSVECISDYEGGGVKEVDDPIVSFGSGSSSGTGRGDWNLVEFEIVPEPATLAVLALGGLGLFGRRGRAP